MLDDYVTAAAAGVITAAVVILAAFLSRYSRLVEEADKSTRLAKDVWNSVNSRFSVVDARIIDLMAKTEVLSSREGVGVSQVSKTSTLSIPPATPASRESKPTEVLKSVVPPVTTSEGTETEVKVLRLLVEGPRNSAQIKEGIGKSREHTARVMKGLFDRGLVVRNDRNKPYVYEITGVGRSYVAS